MEDSKRTCPTESTKQGSHGLTETEVASPGLAWVCPRSSEYMLCIVVSLAFL